MRECLSSTVVIFLIDRVSDEATRLPELQGDRTTPPWSEMIGEMFGWVHRIEERHGARAWLGRKNFTSEDHSVPHRNRTGKRGTRVCAKAFKTNARFPLTRPTSLEMCY